MLKFWARLIKDNKLQNQFLVDMDQRSVEEMLEEGLNEACYGLDLARPIVQQKHLQDMKTYGFTRFLPESFMEDVDFDRMDVRIFDDSPKKKKG
ncbi:MAG: hypothetical protein IKK58_04510 [Clostridia bacterium]|nr:hypothetical protein [Clostridia bacterium]